MKTKHKPMDDKLPADWMCRVVSITQLLGKAGYRCREYSIGTVYTGTDVKKTEVSGSVHAAVIG